MSIILHLAIGEGDIPRIPFDNEADLIDYIKELKRFDCVWIAINSNDGKDSELIVTESPSVMIANVINGVLMSGSDEEHIHIQQYESYEAAYEVALDMKEINPKCYD